MWISAVALVPFVVGIFCSPKDRAWITRFTFAGVIQFFSALGVLVLAFGFAMTKSGTDPSPMFSMALIGAGLGLLAGFAGGLFLGNRWVRSQRPTVAYFLVWLFLGGQLTNLVLFPLRQNMSPGLFTASLFLNWVGIAVGLFVAIRYRPAMEQDFLDARSAESN